MRLLPLLLSASLAALGCGQKPTALASVQGSVYVHGQPLAGGTIVFTPDPERGGQGPMAWAQIGPDGRFQLATEGQLGATPGWHRITIAAATADKLPPRYRDPELSEQRFEVRRDHANRCELHLE